MKAEARRFMRIAALAMLSVSIWSMALHADLPKNSDESEYMRLGQNLATTGVFGFGTPPIPTAFREPGYPAALSILFRLSGGPSFPIFLIFQTTLFILTLWLFSDFIKRAWPTASPWLRDVPVLLVAVSPIMAQFVSSMFSEAFQAFLLMLALWTTAKALEARTLRWSFAAGAAWAALVMTRFTWLFFPFAVAGYVIWRTKRWRLGLALACLPLLCVGLWAWRNDVRFGRPSLADRGGEIMYMRAMKAGAAPASRASFARSVLLGAAFEKRRDPGFVFENVNGYRQYAERLVVAQKDGESFERRDSLMQQEAVAVIRRHPFAYFFDGFLEIWKLLTPTAFTGPMYYTFVGHAADSPFWPYALLLLGVRAWTALKIALIFWAAVLAWKRSDAARLVAAAVVYLCAIHFFLDGPPRLAVPSAPLIILLVVMAGEDLLRRMRRPRPGQAHSV